MNILIFEIKQNLQTTIIWTVAVSLIGLLYTSMGPVFIDQSEVLQSFMAGMGDEFLNGLGINFDTFFTPVGYFSYIGGFIALALCIQAIIYGIRAFAVEKNDKSIEFLYTKPVSKNKLFVQKLMSRIILLAVTQVAVISILFIATDLINSTSYDHMLMLKLLLTFVPLQYMFLLSGVLIGVSVNSLKNTVAISLLFGIGMYFINMLGSIIDNRVFDYISFFNYYNLADITLHERYNQTYVFISVIIMLVLVISSVIIYNRKDMKVL